MLELSALEVARVLRQEDLELRVVRSASLKWRGIFSITVVILARGLVGRFLEVWRRSVS